MMFWVSIIMALAMAFSIKAFRSRAACAARPKRGRAEASGRLANRNLQRTDAVHAAFDLVARVERGDASRRSRHDDIAGGECDLLRELPNDFRHAPDQLGEVTLLLFGAVHREPDLALRGMADLGGGLQRRAGRGIVEGFADFPRPLLLARGDLQVAAGEVDADAIAVDMIERLVGGDVEAAALHGDDQFNLVVQIPGQRRVGDRGAIRDQHVGMLGKEERGRPLVIAHLSDVLEIVASDAPDAANRKGFSVVGYWYRRLGQGGNDKGCGAHEGISAGGWDRNLIVALSRCADRRQSERPRIPMLQAEERGVAPTAAQ